MKTINRKTLVEGKLQNILKHNPDLRFQVDELGSGRVQVVISEGWCAKSVPLILSRVDVIYLLLEEALLRKSSELNQNRTIRSETFSY